MMNGEHKLAIGANQNRNGAWDHLEEQDSSEDKQTCRGGTIAVYLAAQTSTLLYCGAAFLLGISLQTIRNAFALLIEFPARFGNLAN